MSQKFTRFGNPQNESPVTVIGITSVDRQLFNPRIVVINSDKNLLIYAGRSLVDYRPLQLRSGCARYGHRNEMNTVC